MNQIATIATSAVLIECIIGVWGGRKIDKQATTEVLASKSATSSKAAAVTKNLIVDDVDLTAVKAYAQDTRLYLNKNTLAWNNSGMRLLPSKAIFEVIGELEARSTQYEALVNKFLASYNLKVSAAAFKLGAFFNKDDYPTVDEIKKKFHFRYTMYPVPTSGDFRVDVQNEIAESLRTQFEVAAQERLSAMLQEPWERVYECLAHVSAKLDDVIKYEEAPESDYDNKKKQPRLHLSLVDNALELVGVLDKLNVMNDPKLADCTARMRRLFANLDIKSVRESTDLKKSAKQQVDELLNAFDFSKVFEE